MISVLLPTYNASSTIQTSVISILKQTFDNFELVILDDGSTDSTEAIITHINDARIRYIKLPHQGLTKTLNCGLSVAKYDVIARMDADDVCVPRRFEKQMTVLNQLQPNTILSSWYGVFVNTTLKYCITPPTTTEQIKKGLLLHSYISHPGLMFRKSILLEVGGYRTSNPEYAFEDYETWLAIKDKVEFKIIPEILIFQRFRKESLSNNLAYKERVIYAIQKPYYDDLVKNFGIKDINEQALYRGWREYFFGNKEKARAYWIDLGILIFRQPRVLLAWVVTFLPESLFIRFKESRIKFQMLYRIKYFSKKSRLLRKMFSQLLVENKT